MVDAEEIKRLREAEIAARLAHSGENGAAIRASGSKLTSLFDAQHRQVVPGSGEHGRASEAP